MIKYPQNCLINLDFKNSSIKPRRIHLENVATADKTWENFTNDHRSLLNPPSNLVRIGKMNSKYPGVLNF